MAKESQELVPRSVDRDLTTTPGGVRVPQRRGLIPHVRRASFERVAVAAPTLLAVIVGARLAFESWTPVGDWAAMWLRADDVFTVHTPLIGVYSTHNWAHPGPSILWVVWALKRLSFGSVSRAFALMAVVNGLTLSATVAMSRRWFGRTQMIMTAVAALVITHALGGRELGDFWNPYPPVVWFFAFVVGALALASTRDTRALMWTAVFGSLAAQAHLSFLFLVLLFAAALVAGAWIARGDHLRGPAPPNWRAVVAVLAVFWIPVALDMVVGTRNLDRIRRYLLQHHPRFGLAGALHLVAREFMPWGPVLRAGQPTVFGGVVGASFAWLLPAGVATVALVAVAIRHRPASIYVVPALALVVAAPFLAAGLEGTPFSYLVTFLVAIAAVSVWLGLMAIASMPRAARTIQRVGLLGVVALLAMSVVLDPFRARLPEQGWSPVIRAAVARFESRVDAQAGGSRRAIVVDYLDDERGLLAPGVVGSLVEHYPDLRTLDFSARLHKWGFARGQLPHRPFDAYTIVPLYADGGNSAVNTCILAHHPERFVSVNALTAAQAKEFEVLRLFVYLRHGAVPAHLGHRYEYLLDRAATVLIVRGLFRSIC